MWLYGITLDKRYFRPYEGRSLRPSARGHRTDMGLLLRSGLRWCSADKFSDDSMAPNDQKSIFNSILSSYISTYAFYRRSYHYHRVGPLQSKTVCLFAVVASSIYALDGDVAYAQEIGSSYLGISGSAISIGDNEVRGHDLDFDPGFAVAGAFGSIFGAVRTEGEVSFSQSDLRFGVETEKLQILRGAASLYVDFLGSEGTRILPYAGVGIGLASLEFTNDIIDSDIALTFHGELGTSFAASSSLDVLFFYRFQHFEADIDDAKRDFQSHQFGFGFRFFSCC